MVILIPKYIHKYFILLAKCSIVPLYHWQALVGAGPNWEQFRSAQVPSQLAPRSVVLGAGPNWEQMVQLGWGNWETVFTCLYPFTVQTRPLAGTASGMASDSVRSRGSNWAKAGPAYIRSECAHRQTGEMAINECRAVNKSVTGTYESVPLRRM